MSFLKNIKEALWPSLENQPQVKFQNILEFHQKTIDRICEHLPSIDKNIVIPLIESYLRFVFNLPASPMSRDTLFDYSLKVAVHSQDNFEMYPWSLETAEGIRDGRRSYVLEDQQRVGILISALASNLWRVYRVEVSSVPLDPKVKTEVWNPVYEGLYDFALRCKRYDMNWRSILEKDCRIFNSILLFSIFDKRAMCHIDNEIFLEIMNSLVTEPSPDNHITRVLNEGYRLADIEMYTPQKVALAKEEIVQNFCASVESLYRTGDKKWKKPNSWGSCLFIGDDYTAITYAPFEEVRQKMEHSVEYAELLSFLQKAGAIFNIGSQAQFRMEISAPGGELKEQLVVLIRNDVLWKKERPSLFTGGCRFPGKEAPPIEFVKNVKRGRKTDGD